MKRPTAEQLRKYADSIGYAQFDQQAFLDHYNSNGWYVGRTKMKDWRYAVNTWRRNEGKFGRRVATPRLPFNLRNQRINNLNRRKAELMRMPETPAVLRELESIRIQLHDL